MNRQANYLKIGIFVLSALSLTATLVMFFGASFFEDDSVLVETYLDESVQGLDRGSAVKMRGVQIGRIESIDFIRNEYPDAVDAQGKPVPYILVRMALKPRSVLPSDGGNLKETLEKEVENGLRVRITSQGLTGLNYLELDYASPATAPPMELTWEPYYAYLPSAPSTMSKISSTADEVLGSIKGSDIERTMRNLNELLVSLTATLQGLNIAALQEETVGLVRDARATNAQLLEFMQRSSVDEITSETLAVTRSARRIAEQLEGRSGELLEGFDRISRDLGAVTSKIDGLLGSQEVQTGTENLAATSEALRQASEALPETMEALNATVQRVERIVWTEQSNMEEVMENLRRISENLAELSEEARRNPSGVFFGEAPAHSQPGGPRR